MRSDITFLVHGYNVSDGGKETVGTMIEPLTVVSDGSIVNIDYGKFGLMDVIFRNKDVAKRVKDKQQDHDGASYALGHSNGCAVIVEAARQGAKFKKVLLINPALKVDTTFPDTIESVLVIHTKHDIPTNVAKWCDKIPFLQLAIPNAWGAMGKLGYVGEDKRVTNVDLSNKLQGHSDFFEGKNVMLKFGAAKSLYLSGIHEKLKHN